MFTFNKIITNLLMFEQVFGTYFSSYLYLLSSQLSLFLMNNKKRLTKKAVALVIDIDPLAQCQLDEQFCDKTH